MATEFERRLNGAKLLTAEVLYYMPDHPRLLQSFMWQLVDEAPRFPRLSSTGLPASGTAWPMPFPPQQVALPPWAAQLWYSPAPRAVIGRSPPVPPLPAS